MVKAVLDPALECSPASVVFLKENVVLFHVTTLNKDFWHGYGKKDLLHKNFYYLGIQSLLLLVNIRDKLSWNSGRTSAYKTI